MLVICLAFCGEPMEEWWRHLPSATRLLMWSRGNSLALSGEDLLEELRLMLMTCNLWRGLHVQIRRGYPAKEVINLTDSFIKHVVEVQWGLRGRGDSEQTSQASVWETLTSAVSGQAPSGNQSGGSNALWELGRHNTHNSI